MATADRLLATLKRFHPAKIRAYAGDDDSWDIAVPNNRKRWARVVEALHAKSWSRIELLDKSNALLAVVDNTEPARGLEDLGEDSKASKTRSEAEWIVKLVITAQRDALTFRDAEVTALLQAQGNVLREMSSGMHALTEMYRQQVMAASEVATMQAQAANGGEGWKELLEAAPQLLQLLPVLRGLASGGAVPNGQPKKG